MNEIKLQQKQRAQCIQVGLTRRDFYQSLFCFPRKLDQLITCLYANFHLTTYQHSHTCVVKQVGSDAVNGERVLNLLSKYVHVDNCHTISFCLDVCLVIRERPDHIQGACVICVQFKIRLEIYIHINLRVVIDAQRPILLPGVRGSANVGTRSQSIESAARASISLN